jgi:hypothetical protein
MLVLNKFLLSGIILIWTLPGIKHDMALFFGERFFNSENYYDAITEYKRYIFFNSEKEDDSISHAYYKIGLACFHLGQSDKAISELRKSIQAAHSARMQDERKIDLAVVLIASGNPKAAEFILIKVEMFSQIPELKKKAAFFRGVASLYSYDWEQADEAFHVYFNDPEERSQEMPEKLESLLERAQNMKYRSPKLAKILSAILPGSGQIYARDWRNGLNALLLNFATGYFFVDDILQRQYQDALFNALFIFGRFYRGNRYHAKEAAIKYNERLNQNISSRILEILEGKYSDEKNKRN